MKRNRIKPIMITVSIVLIFALLIAFTVRCVVPTCCVIWYVYVDAWRYSAEFDEYKAEFILVKDYLSEEYPNTERMRLKVDIQYDGVHSNEILIFPDEIVDTLILLHNEAFPYKTADFTSIVIDSERIAFEVNNGRYALVYSPNEKPSYIVDSDETTDVWVKRIGHGWYHVTENPYN